MSNSILKSFLVVLGVIIFSSCADDRSNSSSLVPVSNTDCSSYEFRRLDVVDYPPNCVNFLFQVIDGEGSGVSGLTENDFIVEENDSKIGSEAGMTITPNDQIPYSIKTVLLLDVSKSVEAELENIKQAAISLVENKASNQEIAVYTFSTDLNQILPFSNNSVQIKAAIESISIGSSSTNLYGALVGVSNLYQEIYSLNGIQAGNIILFSDGDDTQGSTQLSSAQSALSGKDFYIIALNGPDYDEDTRSTLQSFEPTRFLESQNSAELPGLFNQIVENIIKLSKSTYWLYFSSPKRGDNFHDLELSFNCNSFSTITGSFNSKDFMDGSCVNAGGGGGGSTGEFDCINGNCEAIAGGPFSSLAQCQSICSGGGSGGFNCVNGNCEFNPTGGTFSSLELCQSICSGFNGNVTDIDGNLYNIIPIGNQFWMQQNLRTSKYNDGTTINNIQSLSAWGTTSQGAYRSISNESSYGKMYNGFAAQSGKLCPTGWRVPTANDFETLISFLGGDNVAGGAMKSTSALWENPNTGATNSSGFDALPAGIVFEDGNYLGEGQATFYWTQGSSNVYNLEVSSQEIFRSIGVGFNLGGSCRCIKN